METFDMSSTILLGGFSEEELQKINEMDPSQEFSIPEITQPEQMIELTHTMTNLGAHLAVIKHPNPNAHPDSHATQTYLFILPHPCPSSPETLHHATPTFPSYSLITASVEPDDLAGLLNLIHRFLDPEFRRTLMDPHGYHALFHNIPIALYRTTPDGRILEANPAMREMLKIDSENDLTNLTVQDFYEDIEQRRQLLRDLKSHPIVRDRDIQLRRLDGTTLEGKAFVRAIYGSQGRIVAMEGAIEDVTRKKQLERGQRVVREVLKILNRNLHIRESFPPLAQLLFENLTAERMALAVNDDGHDIYTVYAVEKKDPHHIMVERIPLAPEVSSASNDILRGRIHRTPDLARELELPIERMLFNAGYRSRLNIPLVSENETIGALNLAWTIPEGYAMEDMDMLNQIAESLTLALIRSRWVEQTQRQTRVLKVFTEITRKTSQMTVIEEVLSTIEAYLKSLFDHAMVDLWVDHHQVGDHVRNKTFPSLRNYLYSLSPDGSCFTSGDIRKDVPGLHPALRKRLITEGVTSFAFVPVILGTTPRGGLLVTRPLAGNWNRQERWFLETATHHLGETVLRIFLQNRIRQQYNELMLLLTMLPLGVIALRDDFRIVFQNTTAARMIQELGTLEQPSRLVAIGPYDIEDLLKTGVMHATPLTLQMSGTKERWFEVRVLESPNPHRSQIDIRWLLIISDVTRERLIRQRMEASEHLAAIGRLAAGIAHDFNNVLNAISGFAQLIQLKQGASGPVDPLLDGIIRQVKNAASMINQLMDYARSSPVKATLIDLTRFLQNSQPILCRIIPENIQLRFHLPDEPLFINGDSTRINQILMNLVVNARDAITGTGTIQIRLERVDNLPSHLVPDSTPSMGPWACLMVEDNGCGIPPEHIKKIFEPFFSTKGERGGTGLGLAQVYGLVKQHNGHITVESEPGHGTRFILYFPLTTTRFNPETDVDGETPHSDPRPSNAFQNLQVLLVEDRPELRSVLQQLLTSLGIHVYTATNVAEAKAFLTEHANEIDWILTDLTMPDANGDVLIHYARTHFPHLKCAIITGNPSTPTPLINQFNIPILMKPVHLSDLKRLFQADDPPSGLPHEGASSRDDAR